MMTTMAALFGGLPLAIGMGVGSELRKPLGITIVGGLLVSQVLTLFTTPVVYLFFDRLQWQFMKLHRIGSELEGEGAQGRLSAGRRTREAFHFKKTNWIYHLSSRAALIFVRGCGRIDDIVTIIPPRRKRDFFLKITPAIAVLRFGMGRMHLCISVEAWNTCRCHHPELIERR